MSEIELTEEQLLEQERVQDEMRAKLEKEQRLKDLRAKAKVKEEYDGFISVVSVARFKPGQPTFAIVRCPLPEHYNRFKGQTAAAEKNQSPSARIDAVDLLGKASLVYPAPNDNGTTSDAQKSMLDAFPGIATTLGLVAARLAEGKVADEGKG